MKFVALWSSLTMVILTLAAGVIATLPLARALFLAAAVVYAVTFRLWWKLDPDA